MFQISRKIEIDAGHRIPYHNSQCRFLHGHRWKIVAHVGAGSLVPADGHRPDSGMVVDFGVIKQVLMEVIHDRFDHRFILWEKDPLLQPGVDSFDRYLTDRALADSLRIVPMIPTAEGLAQYWANLIAGPLKGGHFQLVALDVWETPNSTVTYRMPAQG